jgi:aminopeptidase N
MNNRKKIFLFTGLASLVLLVGCILLYFSIFHGSSFTEAKKLLLLVNQLKDVNEEELAKYNPKSQKAVDVLLYQININLFPEQKKISGDVSIKMKINDKNADKIEINFYDNMKIDELFLNGISSEYNRSKKIISIKKSNNEIDTANVRIIYEGTPISLGFGSFNFEKIGDHIEVYSLSEPVYASTWFPCIDLPDDKAMLDMFITNDSSNVSISNGKLIDTKTIGSRRTFHWKTIYPISTYLISLYSGNYKVYSEKYRSISGEMIGLKYYASPKNYEDAVKDFSDHPKYLKTFELLFGVYPFIKEKYGVAEFWWQSGAMENQTITGIGSQYITGKKFFSDMLIHELAHQWWGNAVGLKTWKDIWLNEGFATYSEALYWEKQSDSRALRTTMLAKFGEFSKGTLYNPGSALFSTLIYNKGAWVLHMLRKEVGNEFFFKILREYFSAYKYGNASTNDFKNLCEKISKRSLATFFNQWIYKGEGIIELESGWSSEKNGSEFNSEINIKQLQKGYDIYKFPLDIKLVYDKPDDFVISNFYISSKDTVINISSKKMPKHVYLDPDNWLLAKINMMN